MIRRWSRYRAKRFFHALVAGLAEGEINEQDALKLIEKALEDEVKSQVLFDSYRRVCLSASRYTGPRLIGLLTAKILSENRTANEEEEQIFMAAEILSDTDFASFLKFVREAALKDESESVEQGIILIESHSEHYDSNLPGSKIDISPLNLGEAYGSWALKAASVGILVQRIVQHQYSYRADGKYVAEDGIAITYTWFVGFHSAFLKYLDLISLAAQGFKPER